MSDGTEDLFLLDVRQDLSIHEGGHEMDGSPTWLLYDPVSDNYFKIGWFEFECLQRMGTGKYKTSSELRAALMRDTTLRPEISDINDFIYFLLMNRLFASNNPAVRDYLEKERKRIEPKLWSTVLTKYLYFRIPLFRPQHRLRKVYRYIAPLFSKGFFIFTCLLLLAAVLITAQRADEFFLTFTNFFNTESILLILISTIFIKLVHEMGHAFVAVKYGVPISSMGIAMIVLYPVFYTETTNAWRLYDRKKRMHISAAGVMAEMFLSAIALLAWNTLPPGILQNLAFFVGFLSLVASLLINMNPLMKFDGYYLLSDYIGIDNLQTRSIYMFKWRLRRVLFGYKVEPPENAYTKQGRFLQAFGLALVIYRFTLYMGIAILVYKLAFKPLGLILFVIEVGWFIVLPAYKEIHYWVIERRRIFRNVRGRIALLFFASLVILAFLPINSSVRVPAVVYSGEYFSAYAPLPAKITHINVQNNQKVHKGDVLVALSSSSIDYKIQEATTQIAYYKTLRERIQTNAELLNEDLTIDQTIAEYETTLRGLERQKSDLVIRAPFDGIVKDLQPMIHIGRWISPTEALLRVVQNDHSVFHGYITEDNIDRIQLGDEGKFYPQTNFNEGFEVRLSKIARKDTRDLAHGELATLNGGPIPADRSNDKKGLVSRRPLYPVNFELKNTDNSVPMYFKNNTKQGIIFIEGEPISLIERVGTEFVSLLLREVNL